MDGVTPNPPAEFSALAMASWIFSSEMISCRYRATRTRPGDAKISPMNNMFIGLKAGRKEKERNVSAEPATVLDPESLQGGAPRASLGFSNDSF
jgi:hypothetical protein